MRRKERFIDAYEGAFENKGKLEAKYIIENRLVFKTVLARRTYK
ncbi:hypothetical protein [Butyrivibrio sp.]|nr:hypothetical protein [Butyrivibrio sp.]